MNSALLWAFTTVFISTSIAATIVPHRTGATDFVVEEIANNLGVPWGMAFLSAEKILITERNGSIKLLNPETGLLTPIQGNPKVLANGQGGLMDVAIPPDYRPGGWIYFTYTKNIQGQGVTTLARSHLSGDRLNNWQDIVISSSASSAGRHFGSRITFDGQGHLFFTIGDRGKRANGQDLSTHAGSVLRVNLDGSVATDNPFIGQSNSLPEIWSYGHRNPQGIAYDRQKQRLWSIEHGPRGGDEINLIEPGNNYGWPVISYGKEYWGPIAVGESTEKEGMEQPIKVYIPSIAPSSLILYSGKAFPDWKGNLLAGALKLQHINRVVVDDSGKAIAEERLLTSLKERIRALAESPEGWIYFSTDSGRILRIRP
ncbi:dehydrogenase [Motiliproteus sp. MSK22-1]|nr:dehydrogenase [Motiliproteus sp. MSK22-1]